MRKFTLGFVVAGAVWAQSITEYGAAAAGGTVGGASGKPVSDSINAVFDKVDQQAKGAAKVSSSKPEAATPDAKPGAGAAPAASGTPGGDSGSTGQPAAAPNADKDVKPAPKPAKGRPAKSVTASARPSSDAHATPNSVPDPPPVVPQRTVVSKPAQAVHSRAPAGRGGRADPSAAPAAARSHRRRSQGASLPERLVKIC